MSLQCTAYDNKLHYAHTLDVFMTLLLVTGVGGGGAGGAAGAPLLH